MPKPKKPLPADDRSYPDRPIVGIGVVIWRGDKVLLIKRGHEPAKGEWRFPGGKQDTGETIMQTAVREAREETGLDITPLGIVTALDSIFRDGKGKVKYHYTLVEVLAESMEGEPRAGDDATDVRWATLEEIEQLCVWPEMARVARLAALQRVL